MSRAKLLALWTAGMVLVAILVIAASAWGSTSLNVSDVAKSLASLVVPDAAADVSGPVRRIVLDLRLPRAILAIAVGAGLAVVGVLLQTTTRNDLADPFLFGLSSGAAAGAAAVITIVGDALGIWTLPLAALVGAMVAAIAVSLLVGRTRGQGPERLIIAGLAVSFIFNALTNWLVFSGDQRAAHSVLFWTLGGLGLASWSNLPLGLAGAVIAIAAGLRYHRQLDGLLAGEDTAASLGVSVGPLRLRLFLLCAAATAALVSLAGVVGFVGLMVPHFARALVGVRHGPLIVTSAILGSALMLAGDLVARTALAPQDLPVGIVTGAAGGLFILVMLLRKRA